MDWETPVDAWYVWIAVAAVSVAVLGLVLALPAGPPPDANEAANTIDRVAASPYQASGSYDHDAETAMVTSRTLSLDNEHGTSHASVSFGAVVPVRGDPALENVTYGTAYAAEYDDRFYPSTYLFLEAVDDAFRTKAEWETTSGELVVRQVRLDSRLLEQLDRVTAGPIDGPDAVTDRWDGVQYDSASGEFYVVLVLV